MVHGLCEVHGFKLQLKSLFLQTSISRISSFLSKFLKHFKNALFPAIPHQISQNLVLKIQSTKRHHRLSTILLPLYWRALSNNAQCSSTIIPCTLIIFKLHYLFTYFNWGGGTNDDLKYRKYMPVPTTSLHFPHEYNLVAHMSPHGAHVTTQRTCHRHLLYY